MLLYPHRRLFYFHIPKTGGQSLTAYLKQGAKELQEFKFPYIDLATPCEVEKYFGLEMILFRKITTIRNSWDRAASAYRALNIRKPFKTHLLELKALLPENPFIHARMTAPQHLWVYPGMEYINTKELNKVFPGIKHKNRSHGPSKEQLYADKECIDLVAQIYAKEIEFFGFRF